MSIDWNAVGTWFTGFATLLAVIVALRLQRRYERRDRPLLSVTLEPESADYLRYVPPKFASAEDKPRYDGSSEREELWLRVVVQNSGDTAARDVEVRLLDILRERDTEPESRSNLWFKVASLNSKSVNILPRGIRQPFDIAFVRHVVSPAAEFSFHLVLVKPDLESWPTEKTRIEQDVGHNALDIGWTYRVHIAALSSNADAEHFTFSIRLNPRRAQDPREGAILGAESLKALLVVQTAEE